MWTKNHIIKLCLGILLAIVITICVICYVFHIWKFTTLSTLVPNYYKYRLQEARMNPDPPFRILQKYNINPNDKYIISVSIFGTASKYFDGLLNLISNIKNNYPRWTLRVHCHNKVPINYKSNLINNKEIQTIIIEDETTIPGSPSGTFWRFLPFSEPGITVLSADVDDQLYITPEMLEDWLKSDKQSIRMFLNQQLFYGKPHISGGLFGCKSSIKIDEQLLTHYPLRRPFGSDELWLTINIYPLVKNSLLTVYTSYINKFLHYMTTNNSQLYKN